MDFISGIVDDLFEEFSSSGCNKGRSNEWEISLKPLLKGEWPKSEDHDETIIINGRKVRVFVKAGSVPIFDQYTKESLRDL